jgi:hypothetical protein
MVSLQAFEIDITQPHAVLTYNLEAAFFKLFENSILEKGKLTTTVKVNRKPGNIKLLFSIVGSVALVPIHIEKKVDFKLGHENKELAAELYLLEQRTTTINIAQHIYDFVSLEVPMKKLHPRFLNDDAL